MRTNNADNNDIDIKSAMRKDRRRGRFGIQVRPYLLNYVRIFYACDDLDLTATKATD
jgi:hypothetical protein